MIIIHGIHQEEKYNVSWAAGFKCGDSVPKVLQG
jgi:hypothetical protein